MIMILIDNAKGSALQTIIKHVMCALKIINTKKVTLLNCLKLYKKLINGQAILRF